MQTYGDPEYVQRRDLLVNSVKKLFLALGSDGYTIVTTYICTWES